MTGDRYSVVFAKLEPAAASAAEDSDDDDDDDDDDKWLFSHETCKRCTSVKVYGS
jgi:hypothetical protein